MMAETAHFTATSSVHPSIFELVAADGLYASLQPAAKHLCKVLVSRYQSSILQFLLEQCFDELFLSINFIVQKHYLQIYAGSVAEHFYGLRRAMADAAAGYDRSQDDGASLLSPALVRRSLLWLCLFPYVRNKLQCWLENAQEYMNMTPGQQVWRGRLRRCFLRVYPFIHLVGSLSVVYFHLAYLLGGSQYHSPLMRLAGVRLMFMDERDWTAIERRRKKLASWTYLRRYGLGWALLLRGLHVTGGVLTHSLQVGSFLLQFLHWWNSDETAQTRRLGQVDVPPPQLNNYQQSLYEGSKADDEGCPICRSFSADEAVLAVSGYVFCYSCIMEHVLLNGRCPVSGYPASTEQIYRLYPPLS